MDVVIVEDSKLIRDQLVRLLTATAGIAVVATASEENEAVDLVVGRRPDAVVLDLALAQGSGINVLRRLRAAGCSAHILVLTNHASEPLRRACLELGAAGFYDKSLEAQQCIERLLSLLPPSARFEPESES